LFFTRSLYLLPEINKSTDSKISVILNLFKFI